MSKPTIEELEAILNSEEDIPVRILSNGEVTWPENTSHELKKCPRCEKVYLKEVKFWDGDCCSAKCKKPVKKCQHCGQEIKEPLKRRLLTGTPLERLTYLRKSHYLDLLVRMDGQDFLFEGDWIKDLKIST